MNECSMMVSIGYLKRIACIFESRSQNEEKIMLACMKEGIWIVLMSVLMIYRYENQVWKYVYKLSKELWFGYISGLTQIVAVAILRMKPQPFVSQPQPKPLHGG
jgi:hypothetical protein